jgi:hypothetical protein
MFEIRFALELNCKVLFNHFIGLAQNKIYLKINNLLFDGKWFIITEKLSDKEIQVQK